MSVNWNDIAETFRHRVRRIVSVRGLAWVGIALVGLLWTAGLVDWTLNLDNSWVRLVIAVGIVIALGVTVWRTFIRPLTIPLSDVDIARMIEQCDPGWGDHLSSAAQFRSARQNQQLGSSELQQAVITDVDGRLARIDLSQTFATTSTKRLVTIALVVCIVGIGGALWQHAAAATALSRLAMPFADISWPRTTALQFLDADLRTLDQGPQRTTAGEPVPLYLENRLGPLPENVALQLQLPDGRQEVRELQSTVLRDEVGQSHEVGIATLTAHQGPVKFRAVGGDDTEMAWRTLEVMPAPALASVTVTITPPDYAHQQPRTLSGAGAVEALIGSHVQFVGRANKPLASAWLHREGLSPQEMTLSDNQDKFTVAFPVNQPGHTWFWFDLTDEFGLGPSNPPRYELRGIVDRKPTVYLDQPAEDITVTPDADVLLRIIARDDLGIESLNLVYLQTNDSPARRSLEMSAPRPTEETFEMVWSLASLGLTAGDRVTYHAEAVDAFDLPQAETTKEGEVSSEGESAANSPTRPPGAVGQVGVSAYRHIDILSSEEKQQELATRQLRILDSLQELQDRQSRALETTAGLRIQAELADQLQNEDLDLLKQTELEQQNIREQLSDEQTGAAREVESIQQELRRNHIEDPQLAGRLDRLSQDLRILTEEHLPQVEQSLARARKLSQSSTEESPSTKPDDARENDSEIGDPQQQLQRAEQAQARSLAVMQAATADLGDWQKLYEVLSELDELIVDQTDIQHQTQDVGRQTLTKRSEDLTSQQQADLARLSDRQRRLADRLGELIKHGTQPPPEGESPSPSVEAVQEALRQLDKRRTPGQMHNAAESLRRNNIVQTAEAQEQVLSDLRNFGELLHSADENAAETMLSTLEKQAEEVETLKKRQEQLARNTRQELQSTDDPEHEPQLQQLIKQQEQLAQRAEELARQLRRQQNRRSAQSAGRAARRMREAQQGIEQQQPQQTATSQEEALADLQQLADELAHKQREVEQQLAQHQLEQLADNLQTVATRQQALIEATIALEEQRQQRGSWSRSLRKDLHESTEQQTSLAEQLNELRTSLSEYPVIDLSLEQAAAPMRSAVERMEQTAIGAETVEQQRLARQRLLAMIDVTRQSAESEPQPPSQSGPQQTPPTQNAQGQQTPQFLGTQLRLLRQLQTEVQTRTIALAEQSQRPEADAEAIAAERGELADDQSRIAELTRRLLEQFSELPEEQP